MPKFTQRHYEFFAELFGKDGQVNSPLYERMVEEFKRDNAKFDEKRFRARAVKWFEDSRGVGSMNAMSRRHLG